MSEPACIPPLGRREARTATNRARILDAASRHLAAERLRATAARIGGLARGLTGGDRLDRAVELMWETFSEPHFWAAIELWTAARTNPELQRALRPRDPRTDPHLSLWKALARTSLE